MKHLSKILNEGILGTDLDDAIETSTYENELIKLIGQWQTKMTNGYRAKKGTDHLGNELNVGDWVMSWGGMHPTFGKIINVDWNVRNGSNMTVLNNNKPLDYYQNKFTGGLSLNTRADYCIKIDPKDLHKILKAICDNL